MKFEFVKKNEKQFSVAMFAVSLLLAGVVFFGLCGFIVTTVKASQLSSVTVDKSGEDANDVSQQEGQEETLVEKLKKKNAFVPPPAEPGFPVNSVTGIFGKEALINGQWYQVGGKIGEAEVVSIEPTEVTVKWKDTEKKFAPMTAISSAVKSAAKQPVTDSEKQDKEREIARARAAAARRAAEMAARRHAEEQSVGQTDFEQEEDSLAWMGVELTDSQREKIELVFSRMPEEMTARMKEQWNNMSEEDRQDVLKEIDNISMAQLEQEIDEEMNPRR